METIDKLDAKSPIVEAYRSVRTSIEYSNLDAKLKIILVTSTQQNEGKSTVASNLAISFSKLPNKKILLIDADLRNPSIHRVFSIGNSDGMMSILKGDKDLKSTVYNLNENLDILTTGVIPPNPDEILVTDKMKEFIHAGGAHRLYRSKGEPDPMKTTLFNRLTAGLLAAVLCLSVLAGCAAKPQKELTRYSTIFYDVFDTVTQVIAYCESEEEFTKQMEALHADLISYNQLYDIYNNYDGVVNVKTINDNAGKAPVQVDDRILSMLELARQMYDTTNGKLNVAMGSVLNIWHNYREARR